MSGLRLVRVPLAAMDAMLSDDLVLAATRTGAQLTPWFLTQNWLWKIRAEQLRSDPAAADWVARAAVVGEAVVGHVGFHGPPDGAGMVEVAYSVDPGHRRRGHAREMLRTALAWAESEPGVRTVRSSISPDNTASLRTIAPFGFHRVGEQWDDEDGLEILYERPTRRAGPAS